MTVQLPMAIGVYYANGDRTLSLGARIAVGVVCGIVAVAFLVLVIESQLSHAVLAYTPALFFIIGMVACIECPAGQMARRIVAVAILAITSWMLFDEIGTQSRHPVQNQYNPNLIAAIAVFCMFGLQAAYYTLTGRLPGSKITHRKRDSITFTYTKVDGLGHKSYFDPAHVIEIAAPTISEYLRKYGCYVEEPEAAEELDWHMRFSRASAQYRIRFTCKDPYHGKWIAYMSVVKAEGLKRDIDPNDRILFRNAVRSIFNMSIAKRPLNFYKNRKDWGR